MKAVLKQKKMEKEGERKTSLPSSEKEEGRLARGRSKEPLPVLTSPPAGIQATGEVLFASKKRSKLGFTLVRVLNGDAYSILHYVAIEGKVQQLEVRYVCNAYEGELLVRSKKLCSGGLFVGLEPVSEKDYRRLELVVRRQLQAILGSRNNQPSSR